MGRRRRYNKRKNPKSAVKQCYVLLIDIGPELANKSYTFVANNNQDNAKASELAATTANELQLMPVGKVDEIHQSEESLLRAFKCIPCKVRLAPLIFTNPDARIASSSVVSFCDVVRHISFASPQTVSSQDEAEAMVYVNDISLTNSLIGMTRITFNDFYSCTINRYAIDNFRDNTKTPHNFLTRFHPDQYAGLTADFNRYIYGSHLTVLLVRKILRVNGSFLRVLHPDVPVIVDGTEITAINVPSYPGALMFKVKTLYEAKVNGRIELCERDEIHGSYMHTSAELEESASMWQSSCIKAFILYNNPTVIQDKNSICIGAEFLRVMSKIVTNHMGKGKLRHLKGMIAFNSHNHIYSMERFVVAFAKLFKCSVWVDSDSKQLIDALDIEDSSNSKVFTENPAEADIHILSDTKFEPDQLLAHLAQAENAYHMLAFRVNINNSASNLSLRRPSYNKFPLCIYQFQNPYVSNCREYSRFARFIGLVPDEL